MYRIAAQGIVNATRSAALALLVLLLHLGPAMAKDKAPGLLVMGDSLSAAYGLQVEQGWVSLLTQKLAAEHSPWQVINASISGETTAGGVARIAKELTLHAPKLVVIELGANDGLRGLPLDIAVANLEKMIVASRQAGARVLLLGMRIPPNYGPEYTEAFHAMYADLASKHNVALLPFLMAPIATDRSNYQDDNLHPTAAAQPALLAHVWSALAPLLRDCGSRPACP